MSFITEKEIESLLEEETRNITMPNGDIQPFTAFKLFWITLNYLTKYRGYTEERLVELAVINAKETGRTFDQSFTNSIAYMHKHLKIKYEKHIEQKISYMWTQC